MLEIDGFENFERIGGGGAGVVYSADEIGQDRRVAIKILNSDVVDDGARRRFDRERQAMGRIGDHPNIVDVYRSGVQGNVAFIVMNLFEGGSLFDRIKQQRLSVQDLLTVGANISSALAAMHSYNFVHLDVKPANILRSRHGVYALGDFGISAFTGPAGHHTKSHSLTLRYASPEVVQRLKPDAKADVYSLGATLYTAIARKVPFNGSDDHEIEQQILHQKPPPIDAPDVPDELIELVFAMLEKDQTKRPTSTAVARRINEIQMSAGYSSNVPGLPSEPTGGSEPALAPADAELSASPGNAEPDIWQLFPTKSAGGASGNESTPESVNGSRLPAESEAGQGDQLHDQQTPDSNGALQHISSSEEANDAKQRPSLAGFAVLASLLAIGAVITFVLSSPGNTDDNSAETNPTSTTTSTQALVPTPTAPADLEFVSEGSSVVLRWTHPDEGDVVFHLQDSSGSRIASDVEQSEFVFVDMPDSGECFSVAAEVPASAMSRPLSRWAEVCR